MADLAQKLVDAREAGWLEWIRSEADERAVLDGCWFDLKAAERVRTRRTRRSTRRSHETTCAHWASATS